MTDAIYIWFADNGNIRKWQSQPFAEGAEYVPASTVTSLQTQLEAVTKERDEALDRVDDLERDAGDVSVEFEKELTGAVWALLRRLGADTTEPFTVQDAIDWLNQHLSDRDQVATASVARADEAFRLLGEAGKVLEDMQFLAEADHACLVSWNGSGSGADFDGITERARSVSTKIALTAKEPEAHKEGAPAGDLGRAVHVTPEMLAAFRRGFQRQLNVRHLCRHRPYDELTDNQKRSAEECGLLEMLKAIPTQAAEPVAVTVLPTPPDSQGGEDGRS